MQPLTSDYPCADIHELLTPDLLHQLIKGTFKDHLVDWITEYIRISAESEHEADRIIEEIDRRCVSCLSFVWFLALCTPARPPAMPRTNFRMAIVTRAATRAAPA